MRAQPPLPVGILDGVVRVLEGLIPVEAGSPRMEARPILEASVVLPVGSVALWIDTRGRQTTQETRFNIQVQSSGPAIPKGPCEDV